MMQNPSWAQKRYHERKAGGKICDGSDGMSARRIIIMSVCTKMQGDMGKVKKMDMHKLKIL